MEDKKVLSFSIQNKLVGTSTINQQGENLFLQSRLIFCGGKYWRSAGVIIFLMFTSLISSAQMSAVPSGGVSNCPISPSAPVCPNSVVTYSAPAGMTSYAWSITGSGTINGSTSGRTVNVTAGPNCSSLYKLTITYVNALVPNTCAIAISVIDNTLPKIVAPANKSVPNNTPNIIFDTPTISDGCGTPALVVLSTTSSTLPSGAVNYTRTWKAVDGCGNSSSSVSQTITVNSVLTCSISGNNIICPGNTANLCVPVGAISYLWNTGATTPCVDVTAAGTYTVTVVDQAGVSTCSKTVTLSTQSSCLISGNATICSGGGTSLCGPANASSYLWNTGATTQCINANSAGTYSVTVVESNGCSNSCSKVVTLGTPMNCNISGSSTICAGGSANLCAPAGASAYLWNTGASTQCITATSAGTYSVTITNTNGCTSTCSKVVSVNNPPNVSITGNLFICPGGTTQICAPAGLPSYAWSTGETAQCITVNTIGNYIVTVTGSNGCTSSSSQTVDGQAPLICSISGNTELCPGGSTNLCAVSGASTYLWNTGASTQCITVTSSGTYTATLTNSSGCTSTCSKTVTVSNPPTCSIIGSSILCPGGSTNLCAPAGAVSYVWNNGSTTQCINVNSGGSYSVTITGESGCSSSCNKTVTVNNPPPCSITGTSSFCVGGSTSLCANSGAATYLWSNGVTTQCNTVNSAGTYSVTVTDVNECSSVCSKIVTINNPPQCFINGSNTICPGGSTNLCAPPGATSYLWNTGATTQCITTSIAGNFSVTITNANGCSSSCNKAVTINNPQPCTITGSNSTCSGATINLCGSAGAQSYSWSTGATSQCISVTSDNTYSLTVVDENGCSSTCNKAVTINPPPACSITGNSSFCSGGSTNLCAPAGAVSYVWNTGATTQCISVNSAGNYSVTITNSNGCSSTCNKSVTINNPPNCSIAGNLLICNGGSSILCATAAGASYSWSTGSTNQCVTVNTSGNYSVTVTGTNGCSATCSQNIDILTTPNCSITGNSSICAGGSTSLCALPGAKSYSWNTGATTQCINVFGSGNYTVTVTGANGCTSSCSKSVTVNTPLTCSITGATSICSGGSTTLCAPSGASTYGWSTEATSSCITVNSAGTYSVVVTDANGCISTCSQTVIVNQLPACTITGNNDLCQGDNTTFTVNGGTAYLWNTGATTASITASASGYYSVSVSNASGCSSTCSRTLSTHACGISLKKTPDVCEFQDGVPTTVNFKYVVKNKSEYFSASGNIIDDNATPANAADDINVCTWGPILPGDSVTCSRAFTITKTHKNTAKASGTSGGTSVSASAIATVEGINCNCNLSYPDNSNLPRSAVIFNESEVLRASDPGPASCGSTGSVIKLWYNDEHALLLGVRSVSVKTFSGTTTTNYNITPTPLTPTCIANPLVGDTISTGDQAANDLAAGGGRPLWPSIFITDLTVNGPNSRIGDWQQGGKGITPTSVCGTWKSAVKIIDKTRNPPLVTITTDADPAKINWNLGSGSHTPAGGFASLNNEGYGAEVSWDVNSLGLIPGHTYRLVFMVHDGDQNKTGGDVGETCTTIHIPDVNCTPATPPPPPPPPQDKICYKGVSNSYVRASQEWTINTTTNTATIRTTFSKNFVDNTYGLSAIGWPSGHTFNQLVGSDNLQMAIFDANNVKKMEFKIDYITSSNTVPSGYKCLGVTGGEGSMILGNVSDVVSVTTSIDKNLNTFGYALTTNSPATNTSYTPNSTYSNWIYDVWYEVTVKLSAFGTAGFGKPLITSVHASPSKTGSNTEIVIDTTCTTISPRMSAPDAPTKINAIAYPNPFGEDITITFITPLEEDANITITDVSGRVVESIVHSAGTLNMGRNLRSGIYFVRITQGDYYRIIKIIKSAGIE